MKRAYPCVDINLNKVTHNTNTIVSMCSGYGIEVIGVSKVFCAKKPVVKAMLKGGVMAIGDSRIENLKRINDIDCTKVLLRIPMESNVNDVVKYCDVSLNSEIETIRSLSRVAQKHNKLHSIILMIDEGDLREGVLEQDAIGIVKQINELNNIKLIGLGTNLTCYGGIIPDKNNLGRLIWLKEEILKNLNINIPIISGGNSSSLYMVIDGTILNGINNLRIGEAIVLGRETAFGRDVPMCYNDCFILKGEIIEIKNKPSFPTGVVGMDAFGGVPHFEDKGMMKRAIVAIGRQDIKVDGLIAMDKKIKILGASSDHLILNVTDSNFEYKVGDIIDFRMDYGCLLAAMTSPYVKKYYF